MYPWTYLGTEKTIKNYNPDLDSKSMASQSLYWRLRDKKEHGVRLVVKSAFQCNLICTQIAFFLR